MKIQNSIDNIHDDDSFVISIFLNGRADVRRVIKPVQCNRITNYHAKLKTKATTQTGAPISKCKEKKTTICHINQTVQQNEANERRERRFCTPAIYCKNLYRCKTKNIGAIVQCYFMCRTTADDVHTAHARFVI